MAESNRSNESRALTADFVEKIDKLTKSPSERANFIWLVLADGAKEKITNWDLICFCIETLGFMSSEFPWLREAAIMVNKLVYKAHYLNHDRIIVSDHEIDLKKKMNIPGMSK
ncbi:hypothetical protein LCGC14_1231850 [marine sediment metagenome]|uniref:Uncharacterized protein n=1 Tax=marine sediment metagenome TaxID=412755 RepID=A0A0F9LVI3_9ZZZZ